MQKDCIKNFIDLLKEYAKNIIIFEKKKMLPLTKEELKSNQETKEQKNIIFVEKEY